MEVQGRQHTHYVQHFHGTKEAFLAQKHRDNLKRIWVEEQDLNLVRFNYDEEITEELVLEKIIKAMENGFYE